MAATGGGLASKDAQMVLTVTLEHGQLGGP